MGVRVRAGTQQELESVLAAMQSDQRNEFEAVMKSITSAGLPGTGTQFQPFNLDMMGKMLLPELTPFGNAGNYSIASGEVGDSYEYRAVVGKNANKDSGFAGQATTITPGTGAGLGNLIPYDFALRKKFRGKQMPMAAVSRELAESSGGFNAAGRMTIASLITAKELIERSTIWNSSNALGAVTGLTLTPSITGGTLTLAASPYTVYVSALNYWGWWHWGSGDGGAVSADTPQVVGGTTPGCTAAANTTASIASGSSGSIQAVWNTVPGAHGYIVSMKASGGTIYFVAYTNIPKYLITANNVTFTVLPPTADGSNQDLLGNTQVIDGLVEQIWRDADLAGINQTTPLAGIGGGFTAGAEGCGIEDFEQYFQTCFQRFRLSPTVGVVSPKTLGKIAQTAITTTTGGPGVRINRDANGSSELIPGTRLTALPNQYAGVDVPMMAHPLAPDGEVIWYVKDVDYPGANVGTNLQLHCSTYLLQVFFALMADVAPPGPWGIRTVMAAALIFGRPCGFQNNFF